MGALIGLFKFLTGVILGATTGAAVATFIVTRNGPETVAKLRGVIDEAVESGKQAAAEEEARMEQRRQALIGDVSAQRRLKAQQSKSVKEAKKQVQKEQDKNKK